MHHRHKIYPEQTGFLQSVFFVVRSDRLRLLYRLFFSLGSELTVESWVSLVPVSKMTVSFLPVFDSFTSMLSTSKRKCLLNLSAVSALNIRF
jgi:hypothetical protein